MAFKEFPGQAQGIHLLQRSLDRGRLAHAYLFTGHQLEELESMARSLGKTLNCRQPVRGAGGVAIDCCDQCLNCRKIDHGNHADVHWVRPESKSRVVTVAQMRELMQQIHLKPTEAEYKVAVVVAADRLNNQAANAFLKTLEEPPAKSVLLLLTTEPHRILETILSRCLRMNFSGEGPRPLTAAEREWLGKFSEMAAAEEKSLIQRYRLLDVLLQKLSGIRAATEEELAARSPLQTYRDADQDLREKWEEELTAAIEAEYRRQRSDLMLLLQLWFRDVWLQTLESPKSEARSPKSGGLLSFPELSAGTEVARRITAKDALENLQVFENTQRLLFTNVQEALALEVGLLKLHL
jgi:DNA polymerase-3 subunit delta'